MDKPKQPNAYSQINDLHVSPVFCFPAAKLRLRQTKAVECNDLFIALTLKHIMEINGIEEQVLDQPGRSLQNYVKGELEAHRKKKARRSSFFRRRSSYVADLLNNLEEPDRPTYTQSIGLPSNVEEIRQLNEYAEELENERKDWTSVYRELKGRYRLLNNAPVTKTEMLDQESCSMYLTDEDKNFLADQPDCRNIYKLLDQTMESQALTTQTIIQFKQVANNFITFSEEKLKDVNKEYIKKVDNYMHSEEFIFGNISSDSDLD